jgi:hypothetical protein
VDVRPATARPFPERGPQTQQGIRLRFERRHASLSQVQANHFENVADVLEAVAEDDANHLDRFKVDAGRVVEANEKRNDICAKMQQLRVELGMIAHRLLRLITRQLRLKTRLLMILWKLKKNHLKSSKQ